MKKRFISLVSALGVCAVLSCATVESAIAEQPAISENTDVLAAAAAPVVYEAPVYETVTLKINGGYLNSPYSPIILSDTTLVPLRAVMETLGWNVKWTDETKEISITNGSKTIGLQIGSNVMTVDGTTAKLAVTPTLIADVTYIPLRAVSEALGAVVGWDGETNTASIYTRNASSTLTIGNYSARVGSSVHKLISVCGEPSYKTVGENGLTWYVYADYLSAFMAVAVDGGLVCGYYTNSTIFTTSDGYNYGASATDTAREYKLIDGDGYTIGLYYDKKDGILCAVQYMLEGFSSYHDIQTSLDNQARMGIDVLNSFRYAHGKNALSWSAPAASSSTEQAYYMAFIGELTHTGGDGSSAITRYLRYNPGATWRAWGETICAGTDSIFSCINGWINSDYNRNIILSDKTHAGIGFVYLPDGKFKYCTAMFLIK